MYRTLDDIGPLPIHTVGQIGPKRYLTSEGFLLCKDVPVARTGMMLYGAGELPVKAGRDGIIRITRDADVLFHEDTLASFNGKPVTNDHPDSGHVDARNFKRYSVGVTMNVRRGRTEDGDDVLLADLLITDQQAINDVQSNKREVSAGYDADYQDNGNGTGSQTAIIGNHIALVRKGRCGPRCAIGDHDHTELTEKESNEMGTQTQSTPAGRARRVIPDTVKQMFVDKVGTALDDAMAGLGGDLGAAMAEGGTAHAAGVHIHLHTPGAATADPAAAAATAGAKTEEDPDAKKDEGEADTEKRLGKLETGIEQLTGLVQQLVKAGGVQPAAAATVDQAAVDAAAKAAADAASAAAAAAAATTNDSAALETSFNACMADAEVLVPGFKFPTFDAAAKRTATVDSMCGARREVLKQYAATSHGKATVDGLLDGAELDKLDCAATAVIFRASAQAQKAANNAAATVDAAHVPNGGGASKTNTSVVGKVQSLSALNEFYRKHYSGKSAA